MIHVRLIFDFNDARFRIPLTTFLLDNMTFLSGHSVPNRNELNWKSGRLTWLIPRPIKYGRSVSPENPSARGYVFDEFFKNKLTDQHENRAILSDTSSPVIFPLSTWLA